MPTDVPSLTGSEGRLRTRPTPLRIAAIFALACGFWVIFLDVLLFKLFSDPLDLTQGQIAKDLIFIGATGVLVYALMKRQVETAGGYRKLLQNRVRELECLHETAAIIESNDGRFPQIMTKVAKIVAKAMLFPEAARCSIGLDGEEYSTPGFPSDNSGLSADIVVDGIPRGRIAVAYPPASVPSSARAFLAEEKSLIDTVARQIELLLKRNQAEEEALLTQTRLAHMDRLRTLGELATGIAHEVNQPLTAIATYAQAGLRMLGASDRCRPDLQDTLESISSEALLAGEIVLRLRTMVKRQDRHREPCDLSALIQDVVKLAEVEAKSAGVRIVLENVVGLSQVIADGVQIQQVILNLMRNGIEAMAGDTGRRSLSVRASQVEEMIEVTVADSGPGIPTADEEKLFDPFFTSKESGMGLGLSISKSIVNSHGGNLWFTRNKGSGLTFHFTLPVDPGGDHAG